MFCNEPLCSYRSQAFNARAIQVGDIPDGIVNEPVEFESEQKV